MIQKIRKKPTSMHTKLKWPSETKGKLCRKNCLENIIISRKLALTRKKNTLLKNKKTRKYNGLIAYFSKKYRGLPKDQVIPIVANEQLLKKERLPSTHSTVTR